MINSLFLFNYSLPNESVELNGDQYPLHVWSTEVDIRNNDDVRPSMSGIWNGNTWYGKRTFHMEGDILGDSSADYIELRRQLLRILTPKSHLSPNTPMGVMDITFEGMPEKVQAEFTLDSYPEIPMEALSPSRTSFQLNLRSTDPRMYTVEKTVALGQWTATRVRAYPKTYAKAYTVIDYNNWVNHVVTNSGDIETFPRVVIGGPSSDPIIAVTRNNETTQIGLTGLNIFSDQQLEIDFKKKTAVITGNTGGGDFNVYQHVSGDWWTLEPGDNLVTVYYTPSQSHPIIDASVFWKDAYMF